MMLFNRQIKHPGVALFIYFLIGAVLAKYGIRDGALLLFSLFAGIVIYKFVTV